MVAGVKSDKITTLEYVRELAYVVEVVVEQACELRLELDVPYSTQAEAWWAYVFHPTETAV